MALLKACPRCRALIPHGLAYCAACAPLAEAERAAAREHRQEMKAKKYNAAYNKRRAADDPKYRHFRASKEWRATSKAKLDACGYKCEAKLDGCQRIACEVHHIKPIKTPEGWGLRLDWSNLMGVCIHCHNILDGKGWSAMTRKARQDSSVLDLSEVSKR